MDSETARALREMHEPRFGAVTIFELVEDLTYQFGHDRPERLKDKRRRLRRVIRNIDAQAERLKPLGSNVVRMREGPAGSPRRMADAQHVEQLEALSRLLGRLAAPPKKRRKSQQKQG